MSSARWAIRRPSKKADVLLFREHSSLHLSVLRPPPFAKDPMRLLRNRVLWGVLFLLLTPAASYKLRRSWESTRGFYLWKQILGNAHQDRYVTSDGAQMYFETFGNGEPVLVLHGDGGGPLEGACARVIPDPSLWPLRVRRVVQMRRTQPNYRKQRAFGRRRIRRHKYEHNQFSRVAAPN